MTSAGETRDDLASLLAERDIRNLIARLAHLADDGDLDEYLTLFTEDATWHRTMNDDRRAGHAELRAGAEERRRDLIQGPGSGTRHLLASTWVAVDSDTEARAESYYLYIGTDRPEGPDLRTTGRYRDTFRRVDGVWKMSSRTLIEKVN